jgi:hypothetical protein
MRIEVDLHGYPVWEAVEIAETRIREAWNQPAIEAITFVHGAPEIRNHGVAQALGRGGIKWSLRGCLARGEWNEWVYGRRSKKHRIEDGSMTLTFRPRKSRTNGD